MRPVDYGIIAVLLVLVVLAFRYSYRHRNEACGHNCSSCPYHTSCTKKKKK